MNIIKNTKRPRLTVQEATECLGLKTYDTALPQPWIDDVLLKMSLSQFKDTFPEDWKCIVLSGLVWCYDKTEDGLPALFGYPIALTKRVLDLLILACPRSIWDFSQQKTVIENRETFIIEGIETVRDGILAETLEQAIMLFRAKYPAAKIHRVMEPGRPCPYPCSKINSITSLNQPKE